jgi:arylsulfatase A-like enzyme
VATLWITLGIAVTAATALGALAIARFGDWLYPAWSERLALLGFLVAAAALLAAAAGAALWFVLRGLAPLERIAGRRWLLAGLVLTCLGWLQAPFRAPEQSLYANPLNVALLALGLLLAAALGRGREPWRRGAVLALVATSLLLAATCVWLNLVHLLGAMSSTRNRLNAAVWLAAVLGSALGAALGGRGAPAGAATAGRGAPAGAATAGRVPRYALAAATVLAALSVAPLYRIARAASEPPSAPAAPSTAQRVSPPRGDALNVVLISIDTLRVDHLGIYGYARNTTPYLDRFFADAAVLTHVYAQSPWTLPSHVSMMTGQYPSTHGVRYGADQTPGTIYPMPEATVTVAEILRDAGFATAAFTGGSFLSRRYAFDQGFERYDATRSARMNEAAERALGWLARRGSRPFFLFLHGFDVHGYQPMQIFEDLDDGGYAGPLRGRRDLAARAGPDGLDSPTPEDVAYLAHLYDNELRGTDRSLGRFLEALDEAGLLESTAILLTADHGEEFMEHGRTGHGFSLVQALLRVPLLIRLPDRRGAQRIAEPVQTIDIAPTILDLAGVAPSEGASMQGASLLPLLRGEPREGGALLSEAEALNRQAALVEGRYKYVHHGVPGHNVLDPPFLRLTLRALLASSPGEELYDLEADPGERHDLAAREPALAARYRERLFARLAELRGASRGEALAPAPLTPELAEQLRALGYLD